MGLNLVMVWTRKSTGLISIELVDFAMNSSEISCTIVLTLARFCLFYYMLVMMSITDAGTFYNL